MNKYLLSGIFFLLVSLSLAAQDSLYIYKNGQIIYRSQTDLIDSAAFHPPGYWAEKRSEANFASIQSYPELSLFASMLEQSGYKTKLDNRIVWAPNNAALADVDRNNIDLVKQLVENHLSVGMYQPFPNNLWNLKVTMINQKRMDLSKIDNNYFIEGNIVLTKGIQLPSGHLSILEGYMPYRQTLWEFLNQTSTTDSMCQFIRSFNKKTFDPVTNDTVYSNELLTNISASLKLETMDYTVLIPNDKLWNETVNNLMRFYPNTTDTIVIASRMNNVKRIILKDLFIKGKKSTLKNDTLLITTLGNGLENPTQLFGEDSLYSKLSNGNILMIKTLTHLNSALKEVRVEMENPNNRTSSNCRVITKMKISTPEFSISKNSFINAFPLTTSSIQKIWVQCCVPNIIPGKYNIYAVFVPSYLDDTTKILPYRVNFNLTFPNLDGVIQSEYISSNVVTAPKNISKILIKSDFVANFYDMRLAGASNPLIKVRVENTATASQMTTYSREVQTDCIIFEPVQP